MVHIVEIIVPVVVGVVEKIILILWLVLIVVFFLLNCVILIVDVSSTKRKHPTRWSVNLDSSRIRYLSFIDVEVFPRIFTVSSLDAFGRT